MPIHEASATDTIHAIIRSHPEGVTVSGFMREHKLANRSSVLAAVNRVEEEGKVRVVKSQVDTDDHFDGIKVYPV